MQFKKGEKDNQMINPKVITFDLETYGHDFRGDKSFLLCGGFKDWNKKEVRLEVRDNLKEDSWNDKALCLKIREILSTADRIIGHNSKRFDVPFLNARFLHWGIPLLPKIEHKDTCGLLWKNVKMGASLKNAGEFLGLGEDKVPFSIEEWFNAARGDERMMNIMKKRCTKDVIMTENLARKLESLWTETQNPVFHTCVNPKYRSEGTRVTSTKTYRRIVCTSCKGWFKGEAI